MLIGTSTTSIDDADCSIVNYTVRRRIGRCSREWSVERAVFCGDGSLFGFRRRRMKAVVDSVGDHLVLLDLKVHPHLTVVVVGNGDDRICGVIDAR